MVDVTSLRVNIDPRGAKRGAAEVNDALGRIRRESRTTTRALNDNMREASGSVGQLRTAFVALGGTVALTKLIAEVKDLALAGAEADAQFRQTNQLLKITEGVSGQTAVSIERVAQELGIATLASVQGSRDAANALLTFKSVSGDVFGRTLRSAQDLASLGFGSLESATQQLARALDDPTRGLTQLRRVGVSFTDAQKDQIDALVEANRLYDAQSQILDILEGQIGGAGRAEAGGLIGSVDTLTEKWKLLNETVGGSSVFQELLPGGIDQLGNAIDAARGLVLDFRDTQDIAVSDLEFQINRLERQRLLNERLLDTLAEPGEAGNPLDELANNIRRSAFGNEILELDSRIGELRNRLKEIDQVSPIEITVTPSGFERTRGELRGLERDLDRLNRGLSGPRRRVVGDGGLPSIEDPDIPSRLGQTDPLRSSEASRAQDILRSIESDQERIARQLTEADRLRRAGLLTPDQVARYADSLTTISDEYSALEAAGLGASDTISRAFGELVTGAEDANDVLRRMVLSLSQLGTQIFVVDALRRAMDQLAQSAALAASDSSSDSGGFNFAALTSLFGSSSGGSSGGGSGGATSFLGGSSTRTKTGFQHGGEFRVGGTGGTDSQLVSFLASPNEKVIVQTPEQQKQSGGQTISVGGISFAGGLQRQGGMTLGQVEAAVGKRIARAARRNN